MTTNPFPPVRDESEGPEAEQGAGGSGVQIHTRVYMTAKEVKTKTDLVRESRRLTEKIDT